MSPAAQALPGLVDALVAESISDVDVPELQARIALVVPQVARLEGWARAAAGQVEAVTGGTVSRPDRSAQTVAAWLAEVRQTTPSAAGSLLRTAAALRALPLVTDAVLEGVLTPEKAAVLARLVGRIGTQDLLEAQAALITVAAVRDPVELARHVRHLIATHCEPALEAEAERGHDKRFWQHSTDPDGTLRGRFVLAAEDSEAVLSALEPLARRTGTDDLRSAGQRRADALVEVCQQVLRHGDLPDTGGSRAQLSYVLPADWAAARQDEGQCTDCGPRCDRHRPPGFADTVTAGCPGQPGVPAESACAVGAWSGPQTRARIETILCDARVTRVLLDGTGQVSGLESLTDSVTAAQRRALAARDGGCTARGCTRPPALCDAHHLCTASTAGRRPW